MDTSMYIWTHMDTYRATRARLWHKTVLGAWAKAMGPWAKAGTHGTLAKGPRAVLCHSLALGPPCVSILCIHVGSIPPKSKSKNKIQKQIRIKRKPCQKVDTSNVYKSHNPKCVSRSFCQKILSRRKHEINKDMDNIGRRG